MLQISKEAMEINEDKNFFFYVLIELINLAHKKIFFIHIFT
jgi:hypothetical protein